MYRDKVLTCYSGEDQQKKEKNVPLSIIMMLSFLALSLECGGGCVRVWDTRGIFTPRTHTAWQRSLNVSNLANQGSISLSHIEHSLKGKMKYTFLSRCINVTQCKGKILPIKFSI